jgi:hypothetical protein
MLVDADIARGRAEVGELAGKGAVGEPGIGGEDGEEDDDKAAGSGGGLGGSRFSAEEARGPGPGFSRAALVTFAGLFTHASIAGETNADGVTEIPDKARVVGFLAVSADDRPLDVRHQGEGSNGRRSGPLRVNEHNFYIYWRQELYLSDGK